MISSKHFAALAVFALVLVISSSSLVEAKRGRNREGKLFSLFNVVNFENVDCRSTEKTRSGNYRNGTCFTASECDDKNGKEAGNCAAGFGVCCIFAHSNSGDTINQNCSYIENPGLPSPFTGSETTFTFEVEKVNCDVCFLRLDFEAFTLASPTLTTEDDTNPDDLVCPDTFVVSQGGNALSDTVCGENQGKHMYVDIGQECNANAMIAINLDNTVTNVMRTWEIKITQVECGNPMAPPAGCTEYMMTPTGRITTFNYENAGQTHLINQNQQICIRPSKNSCCVRYTRCTTDNNDSFSLVSKMPPAAAVDGECTADYIEAPLSPDCTANGRSTTVTRLCGAVFGVDGAADGDDAEAMCDCSGDFKLRIHTDAVNDETPATATANLGPLSRGVCLDYAVLGC